MGSRWSRCATQSCRSPFRFVPCRSWIGGWKVVVHRLRTSREVSMFRCHPSSPTSTTTATTMSTASIQVVRSLPMPTTPDCPSAQTLRLGGYPHPLASFHARSSCRRLSRREGGRRSQGRIKAATQVRGSPRRQRSRAMLSVRCIIYALIASDPYSPI